VCKPWKSHNGRLFPKSAFTLNLRDRTIECPNGQMQRFAFGTIVEFDPDVCDRCALRSHDAFKSGARLGPAPLAES
jgi:hypothetical protein